MTTINIENKEYIIPEIPNYDIIIKKKMTNEERKKQMNNEAQKRYRLKHLEEYNKKAREHMKLKYLNDENYRNKVKERVKQSRLKKKEENNIEHIEI